MTYGRVGISGLDYDYHVFEFRVACGSELKYPSPPILRSALTMVCSKISTYIFIFQGMTWRREACTALSITQCTQEPALQRINNTNRKYRDCVQSVELLSDANTLRVNVSYAIIIKLELN